MPDRHGSDRVAAWYAVMVNAYDHLPEADRRELDQWDEERPSGLVTSDWPRWGEFIDLDTFWPWEWAPGCPPWGPAGPNGDGERPPVVGFHLYRLWTATGRLLYVGVSTRLAARLRAHRLRWPDLWSRATWEDFPDAAAMLDAEAVAIRDEDPALNKAGV